MKLPYIASIPLLLCLAFAPALLAQEQTVSDLISEFKGETPLKDRSPDALQAAYTKVIDSLLSDLGSDDVSKRRDPQQTLQAICYKAATPGPEAQRAAICKALAAKLGGDVPTIAREYILRQLMDIGRAEIVPALETALGDNDRLIRETARRALQNNPAPAAGAVLRKALESATSPRRQVSYINALTERKDPVDIPVFLKYASAEDENVRTAAVVALAKLGEKSALDAIKASTTNGSEASRRTATDALLLLANRLAPRGDRSTALSIYRPLLSNPAPVRCAALIGLGRCEPNQALPLIIEAAADPDFRVRGAVVEALNLLPANQVIAYSIEKLKTANSDAKVTLLRALAARKDRSTMATFLAAAGDSDKSVQVEAVKGLMLVGDATAIPTLLKAAASGPEVQTAARFALERLRGNDVDPALIAALSDADATSKAELVHALATRRVIAATPLLLKAATDANQSIRREALGALGAVADARAIPQLISILTSAAEADRDTVIDAIATACRRLPDPETRDEAVLAALSTSQGESRTLLLKTAGRVGGPKALQAIREALGEKDAKIHEAAVRALANWPDMEAASDLLQLAKTDESEQFQVIALQGYVRLVRMPSTRRPSETVNLFRAALEVARRPAEKRAVLGGLGDMRDIAALRAVEPLLKDDSVKEEAAAAAVKIARNIRNQQTQVKAIMQAVLEASQNETNRRQAQEIIDRINKPQR